MVKIKSTPLIIIILIMLSGCIDKDHKNSIYEANFSSAIDNSSKKERLNTSASEIKIENVETFNKDVEYTIYRDDYFNFSVEYPKAWKPLIKDNSIVFVSDQRDISGHVTISLQVLTSHKTGGEYVTVKDVLNDLVKQFKEKTKNFSIHYITDVNFGNVKGTEIKVSYELDNTKYMQAIAIAEGNDYFYALMYFSSLKNYDKYVKIYEHAKNTFSLSIANKVYDNIRVERIEAKQPITNQTDCSICEERGGDRKLWCYAICTGNITLCENFQHREECIRNIAIQTKNISLCEILSQPRKDICIRIIEDLSKNETFGGGRYEGIKNDI